MQLIQAIPPIWKQKINDTEKKNCIRQALRERNIFSVTTIIR